MAAFAGTAVLAVVLSRPPPVIATATSAQCTTFGLHARVASATRAHGSRYYLLELTNRSRQACVIEGYPRVAAFTGAHEIGSPAALDTSIRPRAVTLQPGGEAHVELKYTETATFKPATCVPVTASELRVYLPGQAIPVLLMWRAPACSRLGPRFLTVQPVQPWGERHPGSDS